MVIALAFNFFKMCLPWLQKMGKQKKPESSANDFFKGVMLFCAIDARERRYVVMMDILGALFRAHMDQDIHMFLEGIIAELIIKLEL